MENKQQDIPTNHYKLLRFLVGAQALGILFFFPYYAFFLQDNRVIQSSAAIFASLALAGIWSVLTRKPWALWLVLTVTSLKLTIDLFAWATGLDRSILQLLSQGINLGIIILAFKAQIPTYSRLLWLHKLYYGLVLTLALVVGIWGLFFSEAAPNVLPLRVPPLHARFLASMYLSGGTLVGLSMLTNQWSEVRVSTPVIVIWTGMLGLISLFHLDVFNWEGEPTWIWFVAYIGYPLVAAWMTWHQRSHTDHPPGPPLSQALRIYLGIQGGMVTLLALCLFVAPAVMVNVWPWTITPLLAQIYSAPLLSYGLGSLYALTQKKWQEVRIFIYATLVFTLGVLGSSLYHLALFDISRLSVWVWFSGFSLTSLALALLSTVPSLRSVSDPNQKKCRPSS